ncbi:MAG: hypothetical protein DRH03_11965, partial [Deltaproteobacteria bacterium]
MKSVPDPDYRRSLFYPATVLVEEGAADYPLTRSILSRLKKAEVVSVKRPAGDDFSNLCQLYSPRTTLFLAPHRGRFLKACPGTAETYR